MSTKGGQEPHWRGDGKELYYLQTAGNKTAVITVPITTEPQFSAGSPRALFNGEYQEPSFPSFDVSADGQRFILLKIAGEARSETASQKTSLVVVENWFAELKQLVPPAK